MARRSTGLGCEVLAVIGFMLLRAHPAAAEPGTFSLDWNAPAACPSIVPPRPLVRVEDPLSHAHRVGRDFDELVAVHELERRFDVRPQRRRQDDVLVAAGGADVRELLLA